MIKKTQYRTFNRLVIYSGDDSVDPEKAHAYRLAGNPDSYHGYLLPDAAPPTVFRIRSLSKRERLSVGYSVALAQSEQRFGELAGICLDVCRMCLKGEPSLDGTPGMTADELADSCMMAILELGMLIFTESSMQESLKN